MTAPPVAPRYRVVLPPGFLLLPVQDATDDEIAQTVRDLYRALPRDTYGPRIDRVAAQLVASAHLARDARVLDLILPMGVPWRAPVSLAIAISVAADTRDPAAPGAPGRDRIDTEAGPAVRELERFTAPADPDELAPLVRLRFTWQVPGSDRALFAVCTVSGKGDPELTPLTDGLVELGDLILRTIRWTDDESESRGA